MFTPEEIVEYRAYPRPAVRTFPDGYNMPDIICSGRWSYDFDKGHHMPGAAISLVSDRALKFFPGTPKNEWLWLSEDQFENLSALEIGHGLEIHGIERLL